MCYTIAIQMLYKFYTIAIHGAIHRQHFKTTKMLYMVLYNCYTNAIQILYNCYTSSGTAKLNVDTP